MDPHHGKLFLDIMTMSEPAILVDEEGNVVNINPAFQTLSGWAEQELYGQSILVLFDESPISGFDVGSTSSTLSCPVDPISPATYRYRHRKGGSFLGETFSLTSTYRDGLAKSRFYFVRPVAEGRECLDDLIALIMFTAKNGAGKDIDLTTFLDLGCRCLGCDFGAFAIQNTDGYCLRAIGGEVSAAESKLTCPSSWPDSAGNSIPGDRISIPLSGRYSLDLDVRLVGDCRWSEQTRGRLYFASCQGMGRPSGERDHKVLNFMTSWLSAQNVAWTGSQDFEGSTISQFESDETYQSLIEKTPAITHSIDGAGCLLSVSDAWLTMMEYARDEVIGRPSVDFLTPESRRYARDVALPAFFQKGSCHNIAYQFVTKAGDIRDVELSAISHFGPEGHFDRSFAILNDVTERMRTERALIARTRALKQSNDDLRRFAQIVSHDLQEPLRRVIAYSDILKEDFGSELSEAAAEVALTIQSGGRRLRRMINDLLIYVGIREQLDHAFEPVDLSAVICHSLDDLHDDIKSKGVCVDVAHLPLVWGRAPLLKMVFYHLLKNAIKYGCAQDNEIDVTVDDAGEVWQFAVTDNGDGIEPRFEDRIFKIFQRLDHSDDVEGSGTGLAICKLIIQRCGGDIWLDRSYGGGARFLFTLPKEKPDAFDQMLSS